MYQIREIVFYLSNHKETRIYLCIIGEDIYYPKGRPYSRHCQSMMYNPMLIRWDTFLCQSLRSTLIWTKITLGKWRILLLMKEVTYIYFAKFRQAQCKIFLTEKTLVSTIIWDKHYPQSKKDSTLMVEKPDRYHSTKCSRFTSNKIYHWRKISMRHNERDTASPP